MPPLAVDRVVTVPSRHSGQLADGHAQSMAVDGTRVRSSSIHGGSDLAPAARTRMSDGRRRYARRVMGSVVGENRLRRLDLLNFKAFEKFRIDFRHDAFLVGPNNAGKSTVLAGLRAGAYMIRLATRRKAEHVHMLDGARHFGWRFGGETVRLIDENLRHEFRRTETRLAMHFQSGAVLSAVWPADDEDDSPPTGFFSIRHDGVSLRRPIQIRDAVPSIGVIPVLSPIEHTERLLSDEYVRDSLDGRLASRHLRNQLRLLSLEDAEREDMSTRLDEFRAFAAPWLSDVQLGDLRTQYGESTSIDLFYTELGSRVEKEIFWIGDGMQIWVQLLLHAFRLRDRSLIVLDEPDVFLHADLQRRMVDLLESLPGQTITATHSPEVLAEARDETIVWVSKDRRRAVRSPDPKVLYELSATLGTAFNLRVARALRARTVLFVEGQDAKLLREIARTLNLSRLVDEGNLAVIPMLGFDRWEHLEPFQWLVHDLLKDSVAGYVILDRDYRPDDSITAVEANLRAIGLGAHVWRRKEIENYLLHPAALARLSGAPQSWIEEQLAACTGELEDEVWAQLVAENERLLSGRGLARATVIKNSKRAADERWSDGPNRVHVCGGKDLLRMLNRRMQEAGFKAVTDRQLARRLRAGEIPEELQATLTEVCEA